MAKTFRSYMLDIAPPWLLTAHGQPFMQAIGMMKDSLYFRAVEAVRARFVRYSSTSALAALGVERGLPRSPGESDLSYAGRLRNAWDIWSRAGTAFGMLTALRAAGYENVYLAIFSGKLYSLDADDELVTEDLDPGSWKFRDVDDDYWSRFIVLFPEPLLARWVTDGVPAEDSDEANAIREIIRRWKPAHMHCDEIAIATSAITFDFYAAGTTLNAWDRATLDTDASDWTHWSA